jgi:Circadian oscillating protein COP23
MSSWRDRNERDAKPHTIDVYQKHDIEKNKEKEIKTLSDSGKNTSFLFALLSMLSAVISTMLLLYGSNHNIKINNNIINISNKYICEESSKGNLETLLTRSDGDPRLFIKWNSNYSNSGYTAAERCSQVTAKLNKYTNSENAKYITFETTENIAKICAVKNLEDLCNKENLIISIHRNIMGTKDIDEDQLISPKFIDYIHADNCRNYFFTETQGNSKREVCSTPLLE